ncbi:hypothetical protein [Streptomyces sp. NBC_01022]|uniref:hypothetical protein n=1 Tax=Streptomyces sp. NBC_01022 TaxID=2903723 RepID=UPI002DDB7A4B|nr:hypothetical protein [Streptomyces sp. NBC_01022]WRZ78773.1 hypothetical protein OG316_00060 [Streptomyces sp. NBC_01022]WRZ86906.1 hypothetical protein OG316_44835 [Streptomyces sp. NBC_01022]
MDLFVISAVVAASGLGVRLTAAVSQYLQLRWRVQQEQAHRQTLQTLSRSLPRGSRLEEVYSDGSRLRLTIPQQPDRPKEHR